MSDHTLIAAEVISAYVSQNSVPASEFPDLIRAVVGAFDNLGKAPVAQEALVEKRIPAVPIKKSVRDDYIVSLETGERFQTLRRHLSGFGMTPDEYRAKWGLPHDYPMTAKGYSERRSALAKSLGLGRKPAEPAEVEVKRRRPRPKPKATDQAATPTTPPESVQDTAEAPLAPVEAEASTTAAESLQEPTKAIQEAA